MDNTFTLQQEKADISNQTVMPEASEIQDMKALAGDGYEELREHQELVEIIGNRDTISEAEQEPEEDEGIERPYKLRSLKDKDLWTMLRILRKMNLKEYTRALIALATQEKTIHEVGSVVLAELVNLFIENIPAAHDEIYAFWSELSGIPAEQIEEMEFGTLPLMIVDTFNSAKGVSFFKVLSKLL